MSTFFANFLYGLAPQLFASLDTVYVCVLLYIYTTLNTPLCSKYKTRFSPSEMYNSCLNTIQAFVITLSEDRSIQET